MAAATSPGQAPRIVIIGGGFAGAYCAQELERRLRPGEAEVVLRGRPRQACRIRTRGALAALGCRTAVAKVFGVKLSGFPAWFLWRTVYLLKMPGIVRRLRVALDWTMDLLFRSDTVQLGLSRTNS